MAMSLPSSGQAPSDIDLIGRIKARQDSAAVTELVHRHTGIYMEIIHQYEGYSDFKSRVNASDLKDDKFLNIWQWALKYDPSRPTNSGKPMQFGSYVGEMTKYLCKEATKAGSQSVELDENIAPTNDTLVVDAAERDSALDSVRSDVEQIAAKQALVNPLLAEITALEDDLLGKRLFKDIFNLRFGGKKPLTWRAVATELGKRGVEITHEGARKAFLKHMELIKERAQT
jgi:hypothetical protein